MKLKNNQSGFGVIEVLIVGLVFGFLTYVQNPVSSTLGYGVRPNKTVQKQVSKERVELLKDDKGNVIAVKTYSDDAVSDVDEAQHVKIWEQLRSLPVLFMVLIGFGLVFPIFGARLLALYNVIKKQFAKNKTETKKIISAVDEAFATIPMTLAGENLPGEINRADLARKVQDAMLAVLSKRYDQSTKDLVRELRA